MTEGQPLTAAEFGALIAGAEHTAFRLELQPGYSEPGEAALFDAFLQGERPVPPDVDPELADWYAQIAAQTEAGIRVERVRVQEDPPTAYQEFERWLDPWNIGAGEVIRYLTRADAHEIGLLPAAGNCDWWLLDSCRLIVMTFDDEGRRIHDILTKDPADVIKACRWRDLATHYSTPVTLPGVAA